jgi:hypothetical protein
MPGSLYGCRNAGIQLLKFTEQKWEGDHDN